MKNQNIIPRWDEPILRNNFVIPITHIVFEYIVSQSAIYNIIAFTTSNNISDASAMYVVIIRCRLIFYINSNNIFHVQYFVSKDKTFYRGIILQTVETDLDYYLTAIQYLKLFV